MSSLIVEVCEISDILTHPNADKLEIAQVKGWKVIVQKDTFHKGDKCVYFPPDSVMPLVLADRLGITKYLKQLPKQIDGNRPDSLRVAAARLRGEASFGTIMPCENPDWVVGQDVKDHYGITKWEPPQKCVDGDAERPHPAFHGYTDIENIRNFPSIIKEGEEVVFTEKLHGSNLRLGLIRDNNEDGTMTFSFMAGSHGVRRKEFNEKGIRSMFWGFFNENIKNLLETISANTHNVIIFFEIHGLGVQDMAYGLGGKTIRAFDIAVNGKYLDFTEKMKRFQDFHIPTAPVLYVGPFNWSTMESFTSGPTTLCKPEEAGKFKGREGIVITPIHERYDFDLGGSGRVILKSINPDYLARRDGTDGH